MFYNKSLLFILFFFLSNCTTNNFKNNRISTYSDNSFTNKGFTLVYSDILYKEKIVNRKIDERDLVIFQKNLKKNSAVKITNILNNKSLIAKVGDNSIYPSFNNSVISKRISDELDINPNEPDFRQGTGPEDSPFQRRVNQLGDLPSEAPKPSDAVKLAGDAEDVAKPAVSATLGTVAEDVEVAGGGPENLFTDVLSGILAIGSLIAGSENKEAKPVIPAQPNPINPAVQYGI